MSNSSYVHRCSMQNNCTISADTSLFTDPCPGTLKYLEAHYRCVSSGKWIFHVVHSDLDLDFPRVEITQTDIYQCCSGGWEWWDASKYLIFFFWDQIKYIFILFLQNQTQYFSHVISMDASKIYHLPFRRYSARA